MPPLPKRKRSKSRQGTHAAHQRIQLPHLVSCPHCSKPMRTHRVCPACGFYRGRDVLGVDADLA